MCVLRMFQPEGEDDLKKMQLMELAIINGTFRDSNKLVAAAARKCPFWESKKTGLKDV